MKAIEVEGEKRYSSKVVCVGRNYVEHIEELGNEVPEQMVLFFKPNSAISDSLIAVRGEPLHYEAEIALVVCDNAFRWVGFALDLTKRALQSKLKAKGLPWERCKAFDGSAVVSPFVALEGDCESLELEMWVDGELRQKGGVQTMIHKPQEVLQEVRSFSSLEDYDVVMTGTPKGVGEVVLGSEYTGVIKYAGREILRQSWTAC